MGLNRGSAAYNAAVEKSMALQFPICKNHCHLTCTIFRTIEYGAELLLCRDAPLPHVSVILAQCYCTHGKPFKRPTLPTLWWLTLYSGPWQIHRDNNNTHTRLVAGVSVLLKKPLRTWNVTTAHFSLPICWAAAAELLLQLSGNTIYNPSWTIVEQCVCQNDEQHFHMPKLNWYIGKKAA